MSSFDDIREARPKNSQPCPRCGKAKLKTGQVRVLAYELGPAGQTAGAKPLTTRSRSLCEPCTVEVTGALIAEFERLMKWSAA